MSLATDYSGVIFNQNRPPEAHNDQVTGLVYQDFFLPIDYVRGASSSALIPSLTGVQVYIAAGDNVTGSWTFERYVFGSGWETLTQGTVEDAPFIGDQWLNIFFDAPVVMSDDWLTSRFRFSVNLDSVTGVFYTVPNPLGQNRAYTGGTPTIEVGTAPVTDTGREVSLRFRVLATVADSGVDFLGNQYRSIAIHNTVDNASTAGGSPDAYWMSKANPSQFAVENLYFDMRSFGQPQVVDRILLDPITPNVFFSVYYSTDAVDVSGFTDADWDNLLWTRVPYTFQAKRRETHALPAPISATFIKVEFSHLQARPYAPGDFQKPILYKKHPKWVLDYFLLRKEADATTDDPFISKAVAVTFDALDLAYNYYLDDIHQEPDEAAHFSGSVDLIKDFLAGSNDASDAVDQETLNRIRTVFSQYQSHPALMAKLDYLPSTFTTAQALGDLPNYPSEGNTPSLVNRDPSVSEANRDAVIFEQEFPVMFFFIECRHAYREVLAPLKNDRAYFVGVREIQFDREVYSTTYDHSQYIESMADSVNVERNDFLTPTYTATITRTPV